MAPKQKKTKQLKEACGAIQRPDLPEQLLHLIDSQLHLITNISWGGLSKSWRAVTRQCSSAAKAPWLQLSHASDKNANPSRPQTHTLEIPDYPGCYIWRRRRQWSEFENIFLGCSHGIIVTATYEPENFYYLLRLPVWGNPYVPPWDNKIPFQFATLSSPYLENSNIMVLTGISSPAFLISKLEDRAASPWIKHYCTLIDPYDSRKQPIKFTNAIGFEGKFYALSLQGTLALIEEVDCQFRITCFGKNRAVPSVSSRHFLEYLIESNGAILLIFLISERSMTIVDDVEVFQLDLSRLSWVKMESLGDRTVFLGTNCCMSVTASQVGCKSNRIYFTGHELDGWQKYDMASGSIGSKTKFAAWDEPVASKQWRRWMNMF